MATYKAVMRPALEYASSIWSPLASSTSINKRQVMQNAALKTATWCTQDTTSALILPIREYLQLHASFYFSVYINKQKIQHSSHPNKSSSLKSYVHKVDTKSHPSPLSPLVTLTYRAPIICSTAPTYTPHYHTWICGPTTPK